MSRADIELQVVRLAKRKADELEETFEEGESGGNASKKSKFTPEEIAEGTALAADMLQAWKARAEEELSDLPPPPTTQESVNGADAGEGTMSAAKQERLKQELEILKECFAEFKPRLENSSWASSALLDTY